MTFNYQGFGNSEGEISEQGVYNSALAAYDYLLKDENGKKIPEENIVLYGFSLGSAAVCEIAKNHPNTKVVIDRGYSDLESVAYDTAFTGLKTIFRAASAGIFPNKEKLNNFEGEILIVRGTTEKQHGVKPTVGDGMMGVEHGEELRKVTAKKARKSQLIDVKSKHEDTRYWTDIEENINEKKQLIEFCGGGRNPKEASAHKKTTQTRSAIP